MHNVKGLLHVMLGLPKEVGERVAHVVALVHEVRIQVDGHLVHVHSIHNRVASSHFIRSSVEVYFMATTAQASSKFRYVRSHAADRDRVQAFPGAQRDFHRSAAP